jgi:hypothetical protein
LGVGAVRDEVDDMTTRLYSTHGQGKRNGGACWPVSDVSRRGGGDKSSDQRRSRADSGEGRATGQGLALAGSVRGRSEPRGRRGGRVADGEGRIAGGEGLSSRGWGSGLGRGGPGPAVVARGGGLALPEGGGRQLWVAGDWGLWKRRPRGPWSKKRRRGAARREVAARLDRRRQRVGQRSGGGSRPHTCSWRWCGPHPHARPRRRLVRVRKTPMAASASLL